MTHVPAQYQADVNAAAAALGIPAAVVAAQINEESGFNPAAVSPTGAQGIAQFEPGTWADFGSGSPFDPSNAFAAYTKYMKALLKQEGGDVRKALEAYNAGPGNLPAGAGYATTILNNAGTGDVTSSGGSGSSSSGGTAGATGAGFSINGIVGWIAQLAGGDPVAAMIGTIFGPVANVLVNVDQALTTTMHAVLWLVNPMNWVRIIAGIIGGASAIAGAVIIARAA